MKRFLPILSLAFVMVACTTTPKEEAAKAPAVGIQLPPYNPDTVGLAQYQQWKMQNELAAKPEITEQPTKVVYVQAPAPKAKAVRKPVAQRSTAPRATAPAPANEGVAIADESANEAKAPVKEGWSKAAKGGAIGAGAGAAAGAILVKKNRVLGGVIGGVVGGAVGYGVGRGMDKRDGRY